MPVCHGALVLVKRLFNRNVACDALVTGSIFTFCRLACLFVKRRITTPNGKRRSLLDSTLFRADRYMEQRKRLPFSLALFFTFHFAALSECRSCPEVCSRRFVPVGTLTLSRSWRILRWRTYPVRMAIRFSRFRCGYKTIVAKKITLSRISKFPRLWMRTGRAGNEGRTQCR